MNFDFPYTDSNRIDSLPLFITHLQTRLQQPLPGYDGQRFMAPLPARTYLPPENAEYRDSAVLALLFQRTIDSELELVLTVRSSDLKSHSGQISFPGGRCDDGETFIETALRETREEIGLEPRHIIPIGELSPLYIPVSTSLIHPIVGFMAGVPEAVASEAEVEEVFFVHLKEFFNKENLRQGRWAMLGREVDVPYWNVHPSVPLWGATAMMVSELITLYEDFLSVGK